MSTDRPKRWAVIVLAVLGVALIAMPAVFQMFSRAPKGAQMITAFKPFMTVSRLNGFQADLRYIGNGVHEGASPWRRAPYAALRSRINGAIDPPSPAL